MLKVIQMLMDITGNDLDLSDQHVDMVCDVHGL